ncbi:MAG TPA: ABC transporter ATP-binding protein [Acidimicrobiia bacterium]
MNGLIESRGLVRHFGDERAVDGIDLVVDAGDVHAIVGLNGAGKTTLMRLLLGMVRPDAGVASVLGSNVVEAGPSIWSRVGYLVETPFYYPDLTTRENIAIAATLHGVDQTGLDDSVAKTLAILELDHWADRKAKTLSLGNRQRLGLATALVHEPRVLLLDEPANALDPAGVVLVRDLLREQASLGAAILVSSHHLDQLARVADAITVMHRGRVVGALDPSDSDLEQRFFDLVREADQDVPLERR